LCQVVETALVVYVATKYSCNCTKDCNFKVWTLNCRLLAWQLSTIDWKISVWCLSTRTRTTSECSVVWWMVLPFYQYLIWPMVFIWS
jgi:hypothetical protein